MIGKDTTRGGSHLYAILEHWRATGAPAPETGDIFYGNAGCDVACKDTVTNSSGRLLSMSDETTAIAVSNSDAGAAEVKTGRHVATLNQVGALGKGYET